MGNSQEQSKAIQAGTDKMVLQLRSRSIIIHYGYKFSLTIGDLAMFPHGLSGLKLWQSNIVLARFVVINNHLFKGRKVLELGAGTGIGGIAVSEWTKCQSIAMSDSREQVIKNMTKNCERNNITNIVIFRLNLSQFHHFTNKYDVLLCSEILRPTPLSFQQIYNLFKHFLNPGGCVYIIMSDNIQKIDAFSGLVNSEQFEFKYEKLVDEEYYASPLLNKVEGYKEFERLQQEDYYVVKMKKKQSIQEKVILKKLPELSQTKPIQKKEETIQRKEEQVKQEESPIKAFTQNVKIEENDVCEREQEQKKKIQELKAKQISQEEEEEPQKPQEKYQENKQQEQLSQEDKWENAQQEHIVVPAQSNTTAQQTQEQTPNSNEHYQETQSTEKQQQKEQIITQPIQQPKQVSSEVITKQPYKIEPNHQHTYKTYNEQQAFQYAKQQESQPQNQVLIEEKPIQQPTQPVQEINQTSNTEKVVQTQQLQQKQQTLQQQSLQPIQQPFENSQISKVETQLEPTQTQSSQPTQEKPQQPSESQPQNGNENENEPQKEQNPLEKDENQPQKDEHKQSKNKKNKKKR